MTKIDRFLQNAESVEAEASDWLARLDAEGYFQGPSSIEQLASQHSDFGAWVSASVERRVAFLRLLNAWQRSARLAALHDPAVSVGAGRSKTAWTVGATALAAAAAIAVVSVFSLTTAPPALQPVDVIHATVIGETRTLTLEDGSQVTLNTNTQLRVSFEDAVRRVSLDTGEAFFEVAGDSARPFIVDSAHGRVEVLGTAFAVETRGDMIEVTVAEGTVGLSASGVAGVKPDRLAPGMIGYAGANGVVLEMVGLESVEERLLWREGRLRFTATPLSEVVTEFNRYNTKPMQIMDAEVGAIEIGGTFTATNAEAFAHLAENGLGLRVLHRPDTVELSSRD